MENGITLRYRGMSATALPFTGTDEEAEANFRTHFFGDEGRCYDCDCRPWGVWAKYPCGGADRTEDRYFDGSDGARWREVWEVVGGIETLVFAERTDQPKPTGE
jgi:hypothetical protein